MSDLAKMRVVYKGYTLELGELEEPRKAYWKIVASPEFLDQSCDFWQQHEVECGSFEDLQRIAFREIDKLCQG